MDHVAIMKKSWGYIPNILSGEKQIESRWYKARFSPWGRIAQGDTVYFKNAGELVIARARVRRVLQFDHYTRPQLHDLLHTYGGPGGINFVHPLAEVETWALKRNYCVLVFLEHVQQVAPFAIDKKGFGNACAWIAIDDISRIKIK